MVMFPNGHFTDKVHDTWDMLQDTLERGERRGECG